MIEFLFSSYCILQAIQHFDISLLLLTFTIALSAFNLFLYCYYGAFATDFYSKYANCVYESNWLTLPTNIQKNYVLMIIIYSHQSVVYHGGNIIVLNLKTFLKVKSCINILIDRL